MQLGDFFVSTAVLEGGASMSKEELIRLLLSKLALDGHLAEADLSAVLEAVMRREKLGSTGIGRGIAIPHAKYASVERRIAILSVCRNPVEFESIDGEPADIFALILTPPEPPGGYLKVLPGAIDLMRRLMDERFTARLRQSKSAEEIAKALRTPDELR